MDLNHRALLAAELINDDLIDGYADAKASLPPEPPTSRGLRYNNYMRGFERAMQQMHTSVDEEFQNRTGRKLCSVCANNYAPHQWGSIKAFQEGWFIQKDGVVYCPEHVPEWVEEWREAQREKN